MNDIKEIMFQYNNHSSSTIQLQWQFKDVFFVKRTMNPLVIGRSMLNITTRARIRDVTGIGTDGSLRMLPVMNRHVYFTVHLLFIG